MPALSKMAAEASALDALLGNSAEALIFKMLFYGPSRVGKTHFSLTGSEFWPKDPQEVKDRLAGKVDKVLVLEDVLHLGVDDGALDCMLPLNIHVPHSITFDTLLHRNGGNAKKAGADARTLCKLGKERGAKLAIFDTVSQYDAIMQLTLKDDPSINSTMDLYGALAIEHTRMVAFFRELVIDTIYLCHAKALKEVKSKDEKVQVTTEKRAAKAAKYVQLPEIEPEISGKGALAYKHNCSVMGALLDVGVKPNIEKLLYTKPYKGFEANSRFQGVLDPKGEGLKPDLFPILKQLKYRN